MGAKHPLTTRVDDDTRERVEEYASQHDSKSEALAELIEIGLAESRGPPLRRLRELAVDAAYHLALVAAVIALLGPTTSLLASGTAIEAAVVMLSAAVGPVAIIELLRMARGQSLVAQWRGGR